MINYRIDKNELSRLIGQSLDTIYVPGGKINLGTNISVESGNFLNLYFSTETNNRISWEINFIERFHLAEDTHIVQVFKEAPILKPDFEKYRVSIPMVRHHPNENKVRAIEILYKSQENVNKETLLYVSAIGFIFSLEDRCLISLEDLPASYKVSINNLEHYIEINEDVVKREVIDYEHFIS